MGETTRIFKSRQELDNFLDGKKIFGSREELNSFLDQERIDVGPPVDTRPDTVPSLQPQPAVRPAAGEDFDPLQNVLDTPLNLGPALPTITPRTGLKVIEKALGPLEVGAELTRQKIKDILKLAKRANVKDIANLFRTGEGIEDLKRVAVGESKTLVDALEKSVKTGAVLGELTKPGITPEEQFSDFPTILEEGGVPAGPELFTIRFGDKEIPVSLRGLIGGGFEVIAPTGTAGLGGLLKTAKVAKGAKIAKEAPKVLDTTKEFRILSKEGKDVTERVKAISAQLEGRKIGKEAVPDEFAKSPAQAEALKKELSTLEARQAKERELIGEVLRIEAPKPKALPAGPILQPGKVEKPKVSKRTQEILKDIEAEVARKKAGRTLPEPSFRPAGPATIPKKPPKAPPKETLAQKPTQTIQKPKEAKKPPVLKGAAVKKRQAGTVPLVQKSKDIFVDFDPLDDVIDAGIRLPAKMTEEFADLKRGLAKTFPGKRIFVKEGAQTLDEHAAALGVTEDQLRQRLKEHVPKTVRARNFREAERFFMENAARSGVGGIVGLEVDDEGNPTFNPSKAVVGIAATAAGSKVLTSNRLRRIGRQAIEKFQNSQIRVRKLQELKGVKLRGQGLDPYEAEIRFHGRVGGRLQKVKDTAEKIDKDVAFAEKNISNRFSQDVDEFLIAKHAPERNRVLKKDGAAGVTTANALKKVAEIEKLPHAKQIKAVAKQISDLNKQTLDILRDGQIIDDATHTFFRQRYKDHIPLNRILDDLDNSEIVQVLNSGRGVSIVGTGIKRAKGSQREVADILTNVVANVEQAIVRAEKNAVALSTLDFARRNKNLGLFQELRFGKEIRAIGTGPGGQPIFNTQKLLSDKNILGIRENGKQVFLKINDPSIAAALKMTGAENLDTITKAVGLFTKFVTQTATRFNPAFQIPNVIRDSQEMVAFLTAQKAFGIRGALGAQAKVPQSMKDITDAVFRGKNTPGAQLYKQMVSDGGTTGGLALSTRKNLEIDIEKIRKANRSHPRKVVKELVKFFDNYNTVFEDATRLSVYKESLARGLTREEAAVFAKEATINFNRKGTIGAQINSWYAFANASIQGSAKMIRALRNPKTLAAVTSAVAAGVWGQNQWNDAINPDWREKVPHWERNNNLVILMPGAKKGRYERLLIPASWGIKPIKTFMDYAIDILQGHDRGTKKDIVAGIAGASLDAYNPVGGSNIRQAVTPTILDVPGDIAANQTWFGKPIKPDSPYFPNLSEHKKYFRSTGDTKLGQFTIDAADYLNDRAGVSVSPEAIKYTIEQYSGGTGRFLTRSLDTIITVGSGNIQDINEVPVVRRFFKSTPEDVIDKWKLSKKISDPELKRAQQESDNQAWERSVSVRDAFEQWKESKPPAEKTQILKDLTNKDPKALKSFRRRLADDARGIDYYDSAIKDLEPNFRAERIIIELDRAKDKKKRLAELIKARVINRETLLELAKLGFNVKELK